MGVKELREELLGLLNRVYGFKTETYVLNADDQEFNISMDFRDKLVDFTRRNRPRTDNAKHLLVYLYIGHSWTGENQNELRFQ